MSRAKGESRDDIVNLSCLNQSDVAFFLTDMGRNAQDMCANQTHRLCWLFIVQV